MTTQNEVDANLAALETLMEEFFSMSTSNDRKRDIEVQMNNFRQQRDAWRQCLYFITRTKNHYVCMFALNTLETIIQKQWLGLPADEHIKIRNSLNSFLAEHHKSAPNFIRNKLIKLVVDIARTDWPHFYPDFFTSIMDMISTPATMVLGLNMLLITSEELGAPRHNISSTRKEELLKLMNYETKGILKSLSAILSCVMEKQFRLSNPSSQSHTPPPSPSSQHHDEVDTSIPTFTTSPIQPHSSSVLQNASMKLSKSTSSLVLLRPHHNDVEEVSFLALQCLGHLFTWISLSSHITTKLLDIVFQFAALGAIPDKKHGTQDDFQFREKSTQLGILAMGAINEIMYKNCVPSDFETYLLHLFKNAFNLLHGIIQEQTGPQFSNMDDTYMEKLTEFVHSFVSSHLRRFESKPDFPVLNLLSLLFKYTFLQPPSERYYTCLDSWRVIVDFVSTKYSMKRSPRGSGSVLEPAQQDHISRYRDAFLALVGEILKRLQHLKCEGILNLDHLDDTSLDDDDETEWQHYLRQSIETIMKVADVLPEDVLKLMYIPWKNSIDSYMTLENYVTNGTIHIPEDPEHVKLRHLLKDFATLIQLMGRSSSLFTGDQFLNRSQEGLEIYRQLIVIASYCLRMKFCSLQLSNETSKEFIEVHSQTLASLKSWCHWLYDIHNLSLENPSYESQARELTTEVMMAVAPVIGEGGNNKNLVHSASHFMVTLTGTVRPPSIWKVKEFTDLYNSIRTLNLSLEDHRLMVRALTNVLLLQWPGLDQQRWEERTKHLSKFLRDVTNDVRELKLIDNFSLDKQKQIEVREIIVKTFHIISDLVETTLNENTNTKKLCYNCIKEYIDIGLWLFPIYVNDTSVCESLFSFFHMVFDVLKVQMGAENVDRSIQAFLSIFNKELLTDAILNEGTTGVRVVEKFFGILEFVVRERSMSFRKFIPDTISLCLNHVYPLITEKPTTEIKSSFYSLLFNILLHNHRHFFKPNVVRKLNDFKENLETRGHEEILNQNEFLSIMNAFGQTFMQPDVSVFQQNLNALEELNRKWKLYHKSLFKEYLIEEFLSVFIKVLIEKSHDLLREEILACIYNMASIDFVAFFGTFLPGFLDRIPSIDDNQRLSLKGKINSDTDLPSFCSSIDKMVNDLRYYEVCNQSLPANSVKF